MAYRDKNEKDALHQGRGLGIRFRGSKLQEQTSCGMPLWCNGSMLQELTLGELLQKNELVPHLLRYITSAPPFEVHNSNHHACGCMETSCCQGNVAGCVHLEGDS
jgi:hypothetical protein